MARPRKVQVVVPKPKPRVEQQEEQTVDVDLDALLRPEGQEELDDEQKLAIFHEQFGERDYKVRVEKFDKEDNEWAIVDTVKLDGFDPFASLKKYGGGKYRLTLLNDGGKYVKGGRMEIRIAAEAVSAAAEPKPVNDTQNLLMAFMQQSQQQMVEVMKAMAGRPIPESKGPSLTELVTALSSLKSLSPKDDNMNGVEKTLGLMKLVKEIMPESSEGGDKGMLGELLEAVKVAKELGIGPRAAAAPLKPQPRSAPRQVMPGTAALPNPSPESPEENPMQPVLDKAQSYLPQITAFARRGKDPVEVADFLIEEMDAEIVPLIVKHYKPLGMTLSAEVVWSDLLKKIKSEDCAEKVVEWVTDLAPHVEWVKRVLAEVAAIIEVPPQEEEQQPVQEQGAQQ